MKEKKEKVLSCRMKQSTADAIYFASQKEDRTISYIIERAVRKYFNLKDKK